MPYLWVVYCRTQVERILFKRLPFRCPIYGWFIVELRFKALKFQTPYDTIIQIYQGNPESKSFETKDLKGKVI